MFIIAYLSEIEKYGIRGMQSFRRQCEVDKKIYEREKEIKINEYFKEYDKKIKKLRKKY